MPSRTPARHAALDRNPLQLLRAVLANPIELWAEHHFSEPIVVERTPLGTRLVVSEPAAIRHILVDNAANYGRDTLQQRILERVTGRGLFSADAADWSLQRRTLAPFFSPSAIARYRAGMQRAAGTLVQNLRPHIDETVAVDRIMSAATVDVLLQTLFPGFDSETPQDIAGQIRTFADVVGPVRLTDLLNAPRWWPPLHWLAAARATRPIRQRARSFVAAAGPGSPDDSVIGALQSARDPHTGRALSARTIEDNVSTLIGAGSDTVALSLTWTILLLADNPGVRTTLEAEIDTVVADGPITAEAEVSLVWTRAAIEEAMRLYPPAPLIGRRARGPDRIAGKDVAPGTDILIAPYVVHRHERLWNEPSAFRPHRFLPDARDNIPRYAYLPFGKGPRVCIGAGFAMQEATILLATLLRRFRFERTTTVPVGMRHCITLQPEGGLAMRVESRKGTA